jgi:AhpD family alkylhydroperoxidase
MIRDYSKNYNNLFKLMEELGAKIPDMIKSFNDLHKASLAKGILTSKIKEFITLGIAITVPCDGCIGFHVNDVLEVGASSDEIMETISVAILIGADPALEYG